MKNEKNNYWICAIGPAKKSELTPGCDSPMRNAVSKAFKKITGHEDKDCWSGWGNDDEKLRLVNFVTGIDKDHPAYDKILKLCNESDAAFDAIDKSEPENIN